MSRRQFPDPLSSHAPMPEDIAAFLHDLAGMIERKEMGVLKCVATRVDDPGSAAHFPMLLLSMECLSLGPQKKATQNEEAVH